MSERPDYDPARHGEPEDEAAEAERTGSFTRTRWMTLEEARERFPFDPRHELLYGGSAAAARAEASVFPEQAFTPQLLARDPGAAAATEYLRRLTELPEQERRALMMGDWSVGEPGNNRSGPAIEARHRRPPAWEREQDLRRHIESLSADREWAAGRIEQLADENERLRDELRALYEGRASLLGAGAYGPGDSPTLSRADN